MQRSALIRRLNKDEYDAVPLELARWNKLNGRPVSGLTNRRAAEAGLWAREAFVTSRDMEPDKPSESVAATGTGKAAVTVGAAGVLSTVAQHTDLISTLGMAGPIVGGAVIITAAILFILWRRGQI
jgi:lysozyme